MKPAHGEGGILVNKNGYRYLQDYGMGPETPLGEPKNKYMELGPRDSGGGIAFADRNFQALTLKYGAVG